MAAAAKRRIIRTPKAKSKSKTAPRKQSARKANSSKLKQVIAALRTPKGATIADLVAMTGWQAHSVRGAISGAIKKKLGLNVVSEKRGDERFYRIAGKA